MHRLRPSLALLAALFVACQPGSPPAANAPSGSPALRTLAVVVTAAAGAPVVGADVCAFTVSGRQERCGETSGDADLVDGRAADADGIKVTMIKGVLLTGVVRGPSGPIEDAQICTRTLAAPLPWDCERSKKNGSYLVLVEPGRYFMWTVPPDNTRLLAQWYDGVLQGVDTTDINLDGDRRIDVELDPGPQLRGKVTTTDGTPIAGAFVCVDTPFPTGRICRPTSGDGSYQVTTRPQTYTVQVLAPGNTDLISEYWLGK